MSRKRDPVSEAMQRLPRSLRGRMAQLRRLIESEALAHQEIGPLVTSLKWGQPSFTPAQARTGSSVRLGVNGDGAPCLYFICHTGLVERFREQYGDVLSFEGNRAICLPPDGPLPERELRHCIAMAFTYHLRKRSQVVGGLQWPRKWD